MALVDGMGEAVLPFGDGIASETRVQDGAVFGANAGALYAKGVLYEKTPLISGSYQWPGSGPREQPSHASSAAPQAGGIIVEHLSANAARGSKSPEAGGLVNGEHHQEMLNGHTNGKEEVEEELEEIPAPEVMRGAIKCSSGEGVEAGRSIPDSGSAEYDQLVEMVIRSLDERVHRDSLTVEALELLRLVPQGYTPLPHQVGGHRHVDGKLGFIQKIGKPEILYKPVQPGIKGKTEVQFYEHLFGVDVLPDEVARLRCLIPHYYGRETIRDRAGHMHEYLQLEDITHRFKRPCIMDLKVGRRVWDDFAEQDKIDRERKKYPAQETLGYRIIGMRVYQPSTKEYVYYDKFYGRSVTEESAMEAVSNFFVCGDANHHEAIAAILKSLDPFVHWFRTQTSLRLFASSLLIIYEGETDSPKTIDIRLVDFAHTYECVSPHEDSTDENTLFGLENFVNTLSILERKLKN